MSEQAGTLWGPSSHLAFLLLARLSLCFCFYLLPHLLILFHAADF
jgi:hypothetical protein